MQVAAPDLEEQGAGSRPGWGEGELCTENLVPWLLTTWTEQNHGRPAGLWGAGTRLPISVKSGGTEWGAQLSGLAENWGLH